MSPEIGFVYVVRMEGSQYFKIGRSVGIPKRMSEFGLLLPFPYELRFAFRVSDARNSERVLHDWFKAKRVHGEWFLLSQMDVEEVRAWLLYYQSQWQIQRVVQKLHDETFIEKNVGFPWLHRYVRVLRRLENRDHRRLDYLSKFKRPHPTRSPGEAIIETEVVS